MLIRNTIYVYAYMYTYVLIVYLCMVISSCIGYGVRLENIRHADY